ncbi:MAG: T9SS type A sorting domain-containing protein [Vicingaceae bacterium]
MRKLLLSTLGLLIGGMLSAQNYPYLDVHQIAFVDSTSLANCNDSTAYLGDTVTVRGVVITDGNLSEVGSGSITGGSRPFISIMDTAANAASMDFNSIVVMGADFNNNPVSAIENSLAGDILELDVLVTEFSGLIQLQPISSTAVSFVGFQSPPAPQVISASEIQDQNRNNVLPTGEKYEGTYVELQNVTVVSVSVFSGGSRCEFTVADANGNQVLVADRFLPMVVNGINTVNPNSPAMTGSLVPPSVGSIYNHIRGVIFQDENGCAGGGNFAGGYEINPVYATDFDKAAPPPTVVNINRNPLVPNASQSVTVSADITDSDGQVTSATLFYSADQNAATNLFQSANMTNTGSLYSATIPSFPLDSIVRYYISATDDSNKTTNTAVDYYTVRTNGLTIMDLQLVPSFGSGDASAYDGDTVTVTGIVSASYQAGDLGFLYIQDPAATEYAGIYVDGGPSSVLTFNRGDEVTVTGIIEENFGFTRLSAISATATGNTGTVTPVTLDPSDATYFPSTSELEKYESMLLRYENPAAGGQVWVSNPNLGFADYSVGSGMNPTIDARILAGRSVNGQAQGSLDVSYISDTAAYGSNLNVTPIEVTTSTSMDYVDGILYYAFGNFKLTPRNNNDFGNIVVSIEELVSTQVETSLYPNPAQDRVMIQLDEDYSFDQLQVEVLDLTGKKVIEHRTALHLSSINLSGLEKGLYIVKISNENTILNTSKLILK